MNGDEWCEYEGGTSQGLNPKLDVVQVDFSSPGALCRYSGYGFKPRGFGFRMCGWDAG